MVQAEKEQTTTKKNPLIWLSIVVLGVIVFIFAGSDRGGLKKQSLDSSAQQSESSTADSVIEGQIKRENLKPPGVSARDYIGTVRQQGKPYPFDRLMAQASTYLNEGSLADAHLAFFFAAKEGHVEAMMMMAEMSDPTLFQSENNLLDQADAIQAYKWYRLALDSGFEPAKSRLDNLYQWAQAEARYGNADARQLLLNFN